MKIVFFGSDDFAVSHLKKLLASDHEILACVTQPDRAKGRSQEIKGTDVKDVSASRSLTVYQPDDLNDNDFVNQLKDLQADVFVVIAYGNILPKAILNIPKKLCLNVHASLLPKYRGAAPVNWAIINGEEETGATVFKLAETVDAGEIISQKKIPILEGDTAISLRAKIAAIGGELLLETLTAIEQGDYALRPQDKSQVSYAPKLKREDGQIQWDRPAQHIHNLVRGLLPWPAAYCYYKDKKLKVLETQVVDVDNKEFGPGEVTSITHEGFVVAAGKKGLLVLHVHLESSRAMDARSFIAGHSLDVGFYFT